MFALGASTLEMLSGIRVPGNDEPFVQLRKYTGLSKFLNNLKYLRKKKNLADFNSKTYYHPHPLTNILRTLFDAALLKVSYVLLKLMIYIYIYIYIYIILHSCIYRLHLKESTNSVEI